MSITAVLFDIGGVLEVTPPTGWERRWAQRLGLDVAEMAGRLHDAFRAGDVGAVSLTQVEAAVAKRLGLNPAEVAAFMEDLWAEYLGSLNEDLAVYFAGLRPRFRTGILSNSFVGARERERDAYNFEAMCDVVIYSHEEGLSKPDPRFYDLACRRLGVQPDQVVLVDDMAVCTEAARAAGLHAVTFVDNDQAIAAVEALLGR